MTDTDDQSRVQTILEHATDHSWTIQEIGLLALRLDDRREHRLHVWDPDGAVGDPPIHDHPYDFTSTVIVGEMTNTRHAESPAGVEHRRERYSMTDEDDRRTDTVRLVGTSTTFGPGDTYEQLVPELHGSRQTPGTTTLIRCTWLYRPELTVCLEPGAPWVTGRSRPATRHEIERITAAALDRFGETSRAPAASHP